MTDYTKLIHALRECGERAICNDCPIFDTCDGDIDRAMHDAAAAIEALQAELKKHEAAWAKLTKDIDYTVTYGHKPPQEVQDADR